MWKDTRRRRRGAEDARPVGQGLRSAETAATFGRRVSRRWPSVHAGMELVGSLHGRTANQDRHPISSEAASRYPAIEGGAGSVNERRLRRLLCWAFMINKDTAHPTKPSTSLRFVMSDEIQQAFTDNSLVA